MLVHGTYARGEEDEYTSLRPFLQNAFTIAARFRIGPDELFEDQELRNWIHTINEHSEIFSDEQSSNSESSDGTDMAENVKNNTPNADTSGKTFQLFQDMATLRDNCKEAVQALALVFICLLEVIRSQTTLLLLRP